MSKPFTLPIALQDESARIDRSLELVGRLCAAADNDEEMDALLVREIGTAILEYLRLRNALESIFGRVEDFHDDEFVAMVAEFRRRMKHQVT